MTPAPLLTQIPGRSALFWSLPCLRGFCFAVAAFAPNFSMTAKLVAPGGGGWMLDHHAVLKRDVFSYTLAGQPWDAQEWFSEILMALSFRAASWNGLHLLFGFALDITAALVAGGVRARTKALPALSSA